MRKLFKRNQKGFTLVELVVVIAILGVLAAIAVPRFINSIDEAEAATDDANLKALQAAVNLYYLENSAYPANLAALETDYIDAVPTPNNGSAFTLTNGVVEITP